MSDISFLKSIAPEECSDTHNILLTGMLCLLGSNFYSEEFLSELTLFGVFSLE